MTLSCKLNHTIALQLQAVEANNVQVTVRLKLILTESCALVDGEEEAHFHVGQ